MSVINQISNEIGIIPTSITLGFLGGQSISLVSGSQPLSANSLLTSVGVSTIVYGLLKTGSTTFLADDFKYFSGELMKLPVALEAIISSIGNDISSVVNPKKQKTLSIFGFVIPI